MSIDQAQLDDFRKSLAADDYHLDVKVDGDAATAHVAAGPTACAECLVPKALFAAMLSPLVGVPADRIDVTYPTEFPGDAH